MSSSFINESPSTPENFTGEKQTKPKLIRTSTLPASNFETPPKSHEIQRTNSMSSSPSGITTPVSAISAYLKNLLGIQAKVTKRSLSEEAECGSPESLSEWLRQGSDPNEIDPYGYTPLVNACLRGCLKSAKILMNNGADVNMQAQHGYCPLHAASQNGYTELVELLLDSGAETEVKNDDGDTALLLAVRSEHAAVVDLLCKRGCDLHTHGFDNVEPIDYAINKRNLYLSDVLMKHERQHLTSASSTLSNEANNHNNSQQNNSQRILSQNENINHSSLSENKEPQTMNDSVFLSDE